MVPWPKEEKLIRPGLARAKSTNSSRDFTGNFALFTAMPIGVSTVWAICARSFRISKGRFGTADRIALPLLIIAIV